MYLRKELEHTMNEVRMDERRRKKADPMGSGRPKATGDPIRAYGKQSAQRAILGAIHESSLHKKQTGPKKFGPVMLVVPKTTPGYAGGTKIALAESKVTKRIPQ